MMFSAGLFCSISLFTAREYGGMDASAALIPQGQSLGNGLLSALDILLNTIYESAPYILLGFVIAGVLRFWIGSDVLQRHLGSRRPWALFKAVGVGCVLPLCSCGTIPLGIGLFRNGAARGNMLAFMTATPVLSPVLVALALKMLGWKITLTLLTATVAGAFVMGAVANRLLKSGRDGAAGQIDRKSFSPRERKTVARPGRRVIETLRWSFFELGADVSVDIVIGLGIASLLLAWLPLDWVSQWLGRQHLLTLLYVIALGLPVYACSIPSIAVVQGLLLVGVTPGAAVAYLIAGPATNLGELNAIGHAMGRRTALFYAAALILLALSAGLVTDQLIFPDYQYHAYRVQGELVVNQCCVPMIFGQGLDKGLVTRTLPLWYRYAGLLLLTVMGAGVINKMKHFIQNPCLSCNWRGYGVDGICASRCHVRRKHDWTKKLSGWLTPGPRRS